MYSTLCSCQIAIKLEFSRQTFEKSPNIKFLENPTSERIVAPFGHSHGRTDKQTKLIVGFCISLNAPNYKQEDCETEIIYRKYQHNMLGL